MSLEDEFGKPFQFRDLHVNKTVKMLNRLYRITSVSRAAEQYNGKDTMEVTFRAEHIHTIDPKKDA